MSGGLTAVKAAHAAQGKWSGGPRPFGYEAVDGTLRIRESEATHIRLAAQAILSGSSTAHVAKQWNAAGVPGSRGGPWNGVLVRRVLLRPRNAGINVRHGQEAGAGQWPAIIDESTLRALQASLAGARRAGPDYRWLGSSLFQCGTCHEPLKSHSGDGRIVYRCQGHVSRSAEPVDAWIGDLICARLATAERPVRTAPQLPSAAARLRGQIEVLRGRLDELARLHQRGEIDTGQLVAGTAQSKRDIAALEVQIDKASSPPPAATPGVAGIREWWDELDMGRKRTIIAEQMEWVRIMPRGGQPRGSRQDGRYFDRSAVVYQWR